MRANGRVGFHAGEFVFVAIKENDLTPYAVRYMRIAAATRRGAKVTYSFSIGRDTIEVPKLNVFSNEEEAAARAAQLNRYTKKSSARKTR